MDATGKYLYVLDGAGPRLLRVELARWCSGLDATQPQIIDLAALGISEARGVTIHPLSGNIYVGNPTAHTLYEVTSSATLVKVYNLSAGRWLINSRCFAPQYDPTDDPGQLHLFIADSSVPGQASTPAEMDLWKMDCQQHSRQSPQRRLQRKRSHCGANRHT